MSSLIPKSSSPHFLTRIFICLILILRASDASYKSKTDNNNGNNDDVNQGLTAFFLRDPNDGMCLGSFGFTDCNTESLWLYASRGQAGHSLVLVLFPDSNASCLVGSGSGLRGGLCNKRESMRWVIEGPNGDNLYRVKHVDAGKEMCIVRYKAGGKKDATGYKARLRNSASLLPCHNSYNPESESGYIPLEVVETAVHDVGFYFKTVDGLCFDGIRFRQCHADSEFLWGIGVNFTSKGDFSRTLHKFHSPSRCLIEDSPGSLGLGDCSSRQAQRWGLKEGKLSRDNGKICVTRTIDNFASTRTCTEAFEYFTPEIPEEAEQAREQQARAASSPKYS
mmetsp:Transcript_17043/g.22113  ORF Transcript_17043/g.22113 Transcript_17043/m.22113 type:complete len:336 (-) Transcript_17043:598-1605(-)|eukprot:CAMPEP_0116066002 /NCGR_PEP_ID=MMETSP0322-20121206/10115_1 /TAXON_ID=163516 /ORGANISM="Leptocylindrus danicus var. apora, Strain B651" /LENGTH=335 /DNA_ID=CAMNT_0003552457 /DNA_START=96 /DNA_END=1103 /DNA_ORIENTATION=-